MRIAHELDSERMSMYTDARGSQYVLSGLYHT